jgi:hypothetical protein
MNPPGSISANDLLTRRNREVFVPVTRAWSDHRAWLISCTFHTLFLLGIGLLWKPTSKGTGQFDDRPVGIAVAYETANGQEYSLGGGEGANEPSSNSELSGAIASAMSDAQGPPISVQDVISEMVGSSRSAIPGSSSFSEGSGAGAGNSAGQGRGDGIGAGTKTKASFFGVEGTGSSFVYVVDRSDSMNVYDSGPLLAAKRELKKSIGSFQEYHQFQIVFYNDSILPLSQERKLLFASDTNKDRAKFFLNAVKGDGGTQHLEALRFGLSMGPDVLFFLTDAEDPSLSVNELLDLQRRAERALTTLHAIQFRAGPQVGNGGWIRQLAEMNRGTYRYVDVTQLGQVPEK